MKISTPQFSYLTFVIVAGYHINLIDLISYFIITQPNHIIIKEIEYGK